MNNAERAALQAASQIPYPSFFCNRGEAPDLPSRVQGCGSARAWAGDFGGALPRRAGRRSDWPGLWLQRTRCRQGQGRRRLVGGQQGASSSDTNAPHAIGRHSLPIPASRRAPKQRLQDRARRRCQGVGRLHNLVAGARVRGCRSSRSPSGPRGCRHQSRRLRHQGVIRHRHGKRLLQSRALSALSRRRRMASATLSPIGARGACGNSTKKAGLARVWRARSFSTQRCATGFRRSKQPAPSNQHSRRKSMDNQSDSGVEPAPPSNVVEFVDRALAKTAGETPPTPLTRPAAARCSVSARCSRRCPGRRSPRHSGKGPMSARDGSAKRSWRCQPRGARLGGRAPALRSDAPREPVRPHHSRER